MNYVVKSREQVSVVAKEDAKALMRALSDHDCTDPCNRKEIAGKEAVAAFYVSFEEYSIATTNKDDALTILRWMLDLGIEEVSIKRATE